MPTPAQWRYLSAFIEALVENRLTTDRALSEPAKVRAEEISRWRRKTPAFNTWFAAQLRAEHLEGGLQKLLAVAMRLGMRGSVPHMEFFAKHSGEAPATVVRPFSGKPAEGGAQTGPGVAVTGHAGNVFVMVGVPLDPPPSAGNGVDDDAA